jgi:uncharacterized membrane protein YraQ (UPF0718 family)
VNPEDPQTDCCAVKTDPRLPSCHVPPRGRWYLDRSLIASTGLAALVALSYRVEALTHFRHVIFNYARLIWLGLLVGFLLGGLVERFVPKTYVSRLLTSTRKRSIFNSVLLGFLMSACSHGMLAIAVELHKKGASTPVVVSFLLASPWANLPITLILFGLFGIRALFVIGGALLVALTTGLIFQVLERRGWIDPNPYLVADDPSFSLSADVRRRFSSWKPSRAGLARDARAVAAGAFSLARMTLWWLILGIALSGLAASFIPEDFFRRYMGPGFSGLLATLGLATVLEVCSEGTAPLALELYRQTGAFGNAFVFLMAGVVTDYTEIALVWANMGRRAALWLPAVAVPQVVLLGVLANQWLR